MATVPLTAAFRGDFVVFLVIAYDWGEAFCALNLVTKPVYDELMLNQLGKLAQLNGDDLLTYMNNDFALDSQRSRDWTQALVKYAVERRSHNKQMIQAWVEKWTPLAYRAVEGLAAVFQSAPSPMDAAEVTQSVMTSHKAFVSECDLK